jgi:copper chaperone CopZ
MPKLFVLLAAAAAWTNLTTLALAETKVTLSGVHLCCPQCITAVNKTLGEVQGVKATPSQQAKTIAITADNDEAAQKAIDALAAAGFRGKLDNDKLKNKAVEVEKGNVKRLELTGIHNCCGACTRIIKETVKGVKGVTADTCQAKQTSFVVEGDFDGADLVNALLDAGFQVQVKK